MLTVMAPRTGEIKCDEVYRTGHEGQVGQRRDESTAATPRQPQQLDGKLLRWRLLQGAAAVVQVETSHLEFLEVADV